AGPGTKEGVLVHRHRRIVPRVIHFVGGVFGSDDGRGVGDRQRSAQERRTDEFSGLVESNQKVVVVKHEGHRGGGRGGGAAPEDDRSARVLSGVRAVQKSFAAAFVERSPSRPPRGATPGSTRCARRSRFSCCSTIPRSPTARWAPGIIARPNRTWRRGRCC